MAAKTDDKVEGVREQDKFLPIANISRIMKEALPQNAKISKDAKELVQQCVSDFIIFITMESKHGQRERTHLSRASDKCQREKRKTVNGDDILWAMKSLGFEDAVVVLTTYLQKIREAEGAEKSAKSAAADSRDGAAGSMGTATPNMTMALGAVPPGYVAYAPMPMQGVPGQQVGSVPGQSMQQPMVMYMPIPGGNNGHMVSMPMSAPMAQPPGQPPGPNQS